MTAFAPSSPAAPCSTPARPFLKWAGGKGRLLAQYQDFLPQDWSRYHEPFLGGAALFFELQSQGAIRRSLAKPIAQGARLTDVNPDLVNVYRSVRDRLPDLIAQLEIHQRHHSKDYYYSLRAERNLPSLERAARFIYLNKTCYNGLYRENSQGHFNVPMGRYKNPSICNLELLTAASQALQGIELEQQDFSEVLHQAQTRQDFVYFDPPYHPLSPTSNFTSYSRSAFGRRQQEQLRDVCLGLAQRGVRVMLSNSDCEFVRDLYSEAGVGQGAFWIHTVTAARAINSKSGSRGKISELLITSYPKP